MITKCVLLAALAFTLVSTGQICGAGGYLPDSCSTESFNTNLPLIGRTWQIDIDTTNGQVLWWNPNDELNKGWLATNIDFSNMYHIVMVFGGGKFDLNVDNGFLQTKYNLNSVIFSTNSRITVGDSATTRIIGEKIMTTNVTSYQLTFTSGNNICFGLISAPDLDAVEVDGGDFTTHWGVCVGETYPVDQLTPVCPCATCATRCTTCVGSAQSDCTACESGYYLPDCAACHASCSGCTGPSNTQCSECKAGFFLQPAPSTTCLYSCPAGYWQDTTNNICAACSAACSRCTDSSSYQCSACNSGYFLQPASTICLDSCPSGYWGDTGINVCSACDAACSLCMGSSNTQCLTCNSGFFLQPVPQDTTCISSCPLGFWEDATNHICAPCDYSCESCLGGTNNQCTACKPGFFLQPSSTICLDSCSSGYWEDTTNNVCSACDTACSTCTGSSYNQCSDCNSGYFLQPGGRPRATCLSSCPIGYGEDSVNNTCVMCDSSCSVCTGSSNTQCSICNEGFFLQPAPSTTTCLDSCPAGYWQDTTNHICASCDISCSPCTGPLNSQCSACNPGYVLQPSSATCLKEEGPTSCSNGLYLYKNSSCVAACPPGYFPNTTDYKCYNECQRDPWKCQEMDSFSSQVVSQISTAAQATAPAVGVGVLGSQVAIGGSSETLASSTNAIHLQLLLRYIDAGYPPNVESFFDLTSKNALSNDSSAIPEPFLFLKIGNLSEYQSTWYRFGKYKLSVNFLTNCGTAVITCFLYLVISGILTLVKNNVKPKAAWFDGILYRFKWNLILSCVTSNHSKLVLAWFLQYSEAKFDIFGIINLVISVFSLLGVITLTLFSINHTRWSWKITRDRLFLSKAALEAAEPSQKQFAFITNDYVTENSVGRYCFILSFTKVLMMVTIIFWLPQSPIAQAYLLLFVSILFLLILVIGKPYKTLDKQLAVVINEIIMLGQEVIVAIFATNREMKFLSLDQGMLFGWVFIVLIVLSLVVNTIFPIIIILRSLVASWRNKKNKSKAMRVKVKQRGIEIPNCTQKGRRVKRSSRGHEKGSRIFNDSRSRLKP